MSDRRPLADHGTILSQIRKWGRTKITNRINEEKIKKTSLYRWQYRLFWYRNGRYGVNAVARAHRHYIPGHIWHITHRCLKREFLLKYVKDRHRWSQWLYEAKKRYGLVILDYAVTSNHIHLLFYDAAGQDVIYRSLQLVAVRTGQEYNQRKSRKGAFWEDRYRFLAKL